MIILYFGTAGGCKEPMIYQYSIAPHFGWKIVETVHHENRNGCRNDEIVALSISVLQTRVGSEVWLVCGRVSRKTILARMKLFVTKSFHS